MRLRIVKVIMAMMCIVTLCDAHTGASTSSPKVHTNPVTPSSPVAPSPPSPPVAPSPPPQFIPKGVTLIITGLGLDADMTDKAISDLPDAVVLSFSSFAKMMNRWAIPARNAGHELILELGNVEDFDQIDILSYFDGVLLLPYKNPVTDPKQLGRFVDHMCDKHKKVIDGRLIRTNFLKDIAAQKGCLTYPLYQTLTCADVLENGLDIFQIKGLVTCSADLVPFLIQYFKDHPKDAEKLITLSHYPHPGPNIIK